MKKFSDELDNRFNNFSILKNARVGFEFEFYSKHSYYKTLEELNILLSPILVHGFRKYHSDFKVDAKNFKIEPDWSGGPNCVELITGPLDYSSARIILLKILKWMKDNTTTDERCSLHINVSFNSDSNIDIKKIKILKLILNVDEEYIYSLFPERQDNVYAKTVKKIIPFKDYDFSEVSPSIVECGIHLPDTRYHGINFTHLNNDRLEFRYIGDINYHTKIVELMKLLDYFILVTYDSIMNPYDSDDILLLRKTMDKNINHYKSLSKLEDFMANFPQVILQVDKSDAWQLVTAYYHDIFNELYDLISNLSSLNDCTINWDTARNRMEIVDAQIESNYTLEKYDFISCEIKNSSLQNCELLGCNIRQSHLMNNIIRQSDIEESKVVDCQVDKDSKLVNSFFMGGKIDGEMEGGVLRSGQVGKDAIISSSTDVLTNQNFFNQHGTQTRDAKLKSSKSSKTKI